MINILILEMRNENIYLTFQQLKLGLNQVACRKFNMFCSFESKATQLLLQLESTTAFPKWERQAE